MKTLNKSASKVMEKIVASLGEGNHVEIDNTKGTFMPVVVEFLYNDEMGPVYSVSHYYEQNGDLMRDPDMEFLKMNGYWIPIIFRQDNPPVYQESMWKEAIDPDNLRGKWTWKLRPKMQADHARFANTWMRNIKEQQGL